MNANWTLSDGRKIILVDWTVLHIEDEKGKLVCVLDNFRNEIETFNHLRNWFGISTAAEDAVAAYYRTNPE